MLSFPLLFLLSPSLFVLPFSEWKLTFPIIFFVRLCVFDFENEMVFSAYLTWKKKGVFELEKESEEPLAYLILEKNKMVPRSLEIRKTTSECFGLWTSVSYLDG
uniref:Uncharacterized protein n=1 Tax=Rhizophagus irregularis (strain DAOM 181602 / DAOM 197198 / MUCL 43194) TaxID=747089 RepID=U9TWQ3_RHIID